MDEQVEIMTHILKENRLLDKLTDTVNTKNGLPAALRPSMPSTAQNSHLEMQSKNPSVHGMPCKSTCLMGY